MNKIDAHAHLIGTICGVGSKGELRPIGGGKAQYATGDVIQLIPEKYGSASLTPETLINVMKGNNVVKAVCLQGGYAGFQNLYTAQAMEKYPNYLIGAATFDPFGSNKDAVMNNLFNQVGFKVIKMECSTTSGLMANHKAFSLNGRVMNEIYTFAKEKNLIFYIDIGRYGSLSYQVENLSKACRKYKDVTFIVCHLTAPQNDQIDILKNNLKLLKLPNVYFDLAALPNNTKEPFPFNRAIEFIRCAIEIVGSDKLLWGSDFPSAMNFCTYQESYKYIEESTLLTMEEKEAILYNNASRVFKDLL